MKSENRKFTRRDIDLVVNIETDDGSTICGTLLDLSQGGVRLKVRNPDILPEQFMLKLSAKLHRRSRIAWRSAEEIGVEFLSAPQAPADSDAKCLVLIKCPRTGRNISTGIRLTVADDLSKLSGARRFTQCPSCKVVHGWMPSDALFAPASRV
jgi:PilZ domain